MKDTKRQILETIATILEGHTSDQFGKRLKDKIAGALPSYTIHLDKQATRGSLQKHAISVWGNGIPYQDCAYLCTYNAADWRAGLAKDARRHAAAIAEGIENDARLARIDRALSLLNEDAQEIQARLAVMLESNGIEHVTDVVRKKYPALFFGGDR